MNVNEKIRDKKVIVSETEGGSNQLGYIFWYSVTDVEVTRIELQQHFENIGINLSWLPNRIRPSDAFRRATKEIEVRKGTNNPNIFQNFLVREVYSDNKLIQRNIVIETVDRSGKRLDYEPEAIIMKLIKENNDFVISAIKNNTAKELAMEAKKLFQKYIDYYSAQQLRVMISNYLSSLAPTPVRANGGVYFVPQNYSTKLKKLQLLCQFLKSEGVAIPLYDTADNKNLVLDKLENELKETLDRCQELSKTDNLKKQLYRDSIEEAKRIVKTYQAYKENLELDFDNLENMLDELRLTAVLLTQKITKS